MAQPFRTRHPDLWAWLFEGDPAHGVAPARTTMTDRELAEEIARRTGERFSVGTIRNWSNNIAGVRKAPGPRPRALTPTEDAVTDVLRSRLRGKAQGQHFEHPGISTAGDTAIVTSDLSETAIDLPTLLRQRNLNPDDWVCDRMVANTWESAAIVNGKWVSVQLHQTKAFLSARVPFRLLLPPPEPLKFLPPVGRLPRLADRPHLILVTTDSQVPFHDERLHQISCQFAHDMEVAEWVDLGDFLDLPALSRFRPKPNFHATVQESIDTGHRVLRERSEAAPPWCRKRILSGNHDARADNWILDHAPQLWGLRRADVGPEEHHSVLDPFYLLRAAELGWERATSPFGGYPYECIEIAPGLIGIHGEKVGKGAGTAVRKELENRLYSVAQGHVNKLSVGLRTRWQADGTPMDVWGIEAGYMGRVEGGLGFGGPVPDWASGFIVVTVHPDGSWVPEVAPYRDGVLRWRDRIWRA